MPEKTRHVPLRDAIWSADEAARAIDEIVSDALAHLDAERFWPAHPLDDGVSDGNTSFYFRGDMVLKVVEEGVIRDIPIRAGEVFLLPAHLRHSPQRPVPDSVGLVVENERRPGDLDGFEWFCFGC